MSKIDYQALREAAEKATPDEWVAFISTDTGTYAVHTPGDERCEDVIKWTGFDGQKNAENNARYVAAFNPKVALELLGEIKRLEDTNIDAMCRIAELETNLAALAFASKESEVNGQISIIRPGACDEEIRLIIRLAMGRTITALITPENLALALTGKSDLPVELKLRNVEIKVK